MDFAEDVGPMKDGMVKSVYVSQTTTRSMEPAELVIPIAPIMAEIVSATMVSSAMLINVNNVTLHVESAQDPNRTSA